MIGRVPQRCARVIAAAVLLAAPAAFASTARVALEDVRITLVDLDPDDGVTPSITGPGLGVGRVFMESCADGNCPGWPDVSVFYELPFLTESGAPIDRVDSKTIFFHTDSFGAAITSDTAHVWTWGSVSAGFYSTHGQGSNFVLSDNTKLIITGNVVAYSEGPARANAALNWSWVSELGGYPVDEHAPPVRAASTGGAGTVSTPFEFVYDNARAFSVGGEMRFDLDTALEVAMPSAVPEPATAALAAAGALLLVRRLRRPSAG